MSKNEGMTRCSKCHRLYESWAYTQMHTKNIKKPTCDYCLNKSGRDSSRNRNKKTKFDSTKLYF